MSLTIATTLGIFFSAMLGAGLMALGFLSANSGHDDRATTHVHHDEQRHLTKKGSDRHPVAEELVVLVVAALAGPEIGEVGDELDRRDPLDHLEAELVLAP